MDGRIDAPTLAEVAAWPDRPLRLAPRLVGKPWAGDRLRGLGREVEPGGGVGESWDVADLGPDQTSVEDPTSRVVGGGWDGRSLAEVIAGGGGLPLLGEVAPTPDGRFPLLVKLLDAGEPLSVQVHPTAGVVSRRPGSHLKTESWVVMDAEPGATVLLGLREGVTRAAFEAALGTPAMVPLLREVPVAAGDVLHLPAGTVHALGAGVVVAEVQTPSDTTYRLYDWTEELGRAPRELHLEAGLESVLDAWEANLAPPVQRTGDGPLVDEADAYVLTRERLEDGERRRVWDDGPWVVVVLDGTPTLCGESLVRGDVRLVPAAVVLELAGPGRALLARPR